jgi:hypothetical protein
MWADDPGATAIVRERRKGSIFESEVSERG